MRVVNSDCKDMVRFLLYARADLTLKTRFGDTALDLAQMYNLTEIAQMIEQEARVREETARLRKTAQTLCAIRAHEPTSIWCVIPNELLFLMLEYMAPDGFKRLLKQDQE
jgi:ankyrin repeat protein